MLLLLWCSPLPFLLLLLLMMMMMPMLLLLLLLLLLPLTWMKEALLAYLHAHKVSEVHKPIAVSVNRTEHGVDSGWLGLGGRRVQEPHGRRKVVA